MSIETDVVVIGSGGAGLSAAVSAAVGGARVVVLEASGAFGGTTCFSGGGMWIPNNRFEREEGIEDSSDEAFDYARQLITHKGLDSLLRRYLDECNSMIDFLEEHTDISFESALGHPDYWPHLPGGRAHGRCVSNGLFDSNHLGDLKDKLRHSYFWNQVTSNETYTARHGDRKILFDLPHLMAERAEAGFVGNGVALVGFLLEAAIKHDVQLELNARAVELVKDGDRVTGVIFERDGEQHRVEARLGVVLACGGFEWNEELVDRFLAVPMTAPGSPGHNRGDGVMMAMKAGASLANMTEAWWNMMYRVPGDLYEGRQVSRPTSDVRGKPGTLVVNKYGRRFVNESLNYHDLGKSMKTFDVTNYEYPNAYAYLVFDAQVRSEFRFQDITPKDPDPDWLFRGETLAELAESAGIDVVGFEEQVSEFNENAAKGIDPVFHRGENAYDRHMGDALKEGPERCLRPLGPGPYYAVRVELGVFGTKGGPMVTPDAQVVDHDHQPIAGLYAVGNTAAHIFGDAYPGGGSTLGPALTFGYLAGRAITAPLHAAVK